MPTNNFQPLRSPLTWWTIITCARHPRVALVRLHLKLSVRAGRACPGPSADALPAGGSAQGPLVPGVAGGEVAHGQGGPEEEQDHWKDIACFANCTMNSAVHLF